MNESYTLSRSRRKTVAIIITKDATVEVRAPLRMSKKDIECFVQSKSDWIGKNLAKQREALLCKTEHQPHFGGTARLFGNDVVLVAGNTKTPIFDGGSVILPADTAESEIGEQLQKLYKLLAAQYIIPRVRELSEAAQSKPSAVKITSARTRWGSCTADRLCFSCFLIAADKEAVDYVIFHELSHIKHPDHSPQFWAEVSRLCPKMNECRQRLKELAALL